VLKVGKLPRILARLRLLDETNQTLGYTSFRVLLATDTSIQVTQSFSNKLGVIQIADLEAGKKYIVRFGEDAFIRDLVISIPMNAPRIYNMGDCKVEHESLSRISRLSMAKSAPAEGPATGIGAESPVGPGKQPSRTTGN